MSFWIGNYNFYLPSNMVVSFRLRGILWVQKLLSLRVFLLRLSTSAATRPPYPVVLVPFLVPVFSCFRKNVSSQLYLSLTSREKLPRSKEKFRLESDSGKRWLFTNLTPLRCSWEPRQQL